MASEKVKIVTSENFQDDILNSERLTLVDFWASWCGPCRMVGPVIDELAQNYEGKVIIAKLNVDDCGDVASKYRVMSIPTVILFKNGKEIERVSGARSIEEYTKLIEKNIN